LSDLAKLPKFDLVIASGVIHHLDDDATINLFELAKTALRPGGRFVSIDPVLCKKQTPVARLLVSYDRGQNVCDGSGYQQLASRAFQKVSGSERHQKWIPLFALDHGVPMTLFSDLGVGGQHPTDPSDSVGVLS